MRRLLRLVLLILAPAVSAEPVYRCEDAQGRRLYSDQPCQKVGALPLPSDNDPAPPPLDSSDPELKRWRETTRPPTPPLITKAGPAAESPLPPPAAAQGCAGPTPEALRAALQRALERGDRNALASLYHWPGAGRGAARWVFEQAERLLAARPLHIELERLAPDDAWLWAGDAPPAAASLPAVVVRSAATGAALARFTLVPNAGCVWLLR